MTASISTTPDVVTSAAGNGRATFLPGFGGLFHKELTEWRRARRTWVVLAVSALFMTLGAANGWIISQLPADVTEGAEPPVLDPLLNLVGPVSTHVFVIVAIFAAMALLASERESGTLAWTASKPVSRAAIWVSKFASATGVLWVIAGVLPFLATVVLVSVLYGAVPVTLVVAILAGMAMVIGLYMAVALAASTVVTSQAAVAGITLVVVSVAPMIAALLPDPTLMPTSILDWSVRLGAGEPVSPLPVLSWGATLAALVAVGLRRVERLEL